MSTQPETIYWDPTQEQLNLNQPISHKALSGGGWRPLVQDCESVQGGCIFLYRHDKRQRWYVRLVADDITVASAMCFSSGDLAGIVREFQVIAGVLS